MEYKEKTNTNNILKKILISIVILDILLAFAYYVYTNSNIFNTKLAYQTFSSSDLYEIGETKVIKEEGKAPFYKVVIKDFDELKLSEATYEKYIKNYNVIRVNREKLYVYIDMSYIFEPHFFRCEKRTVERISYPWDAKQATKFTDKEIKA